MRVSFFGSVDAVPLKATAVPAVPVYGPPALATGACGVAAMVTVAVAEAESLSVLVTVRVAV
nr:hypothetical protein [Granulicella tundricola]